MSEGQLKLLGVGTGRDGTVSLTELVNRIYALNGLQGQAVHEYLSSECYANFCEHRETGKHRYLGALEDLIRDCPYASTIGNGYAFVLDAFARASKGQIKLIHIRRRDREACVKSLVENVRLYPSTYRYYSNDPEATSKRTAAFHLREMSHAAWDALSLDARIGWYFDATHRMIEAQRHLFADCITIETEEISTPAGLARLTEFVLGRAGVAPEPVHLNRYSLDYNHLPARDRLFLHYNFHDIDVQKAAAQDAFLMRHFANRFFAWWHHVQTHRAEFLEKDDRTLLHALDEAQRIFVEGYRAAEDAKLLLSQPSSTGETRPRRAASSKVD